MLIAANRSFASRAVGLEQEAEKLRFADLVDFADDGQVRLLADGESARPMQLVHIPVDPRQDGGAGTYLLVDSHDKGSLDSADLQALLEILPIGLALVDRDGRFLTMNRRSDAGVIQGRRCLHPATFFKETIAPSPIRASHSPRPGDVRRSRLLLPSKNRPGGLTVAEWRLLRGRGALF